MRCIPVTQWLKEREFEIALKEAFKLRDIELSMTDKGVCTESNNQREDSYGT